MIINIKTSTLTPQTIHLGAESGKSGLPILWGTPPCGAVLPLPTVELSNKVLGTGELETATNNNSNYTTYNILDSKIIKMNNGEESPIKENTPTKSFASTPNSEGEIHESSRMTVTRLTSFSLFFLCKLKIVIPLCAAHRNAPTSSKRYLYTYFLSTPGSGRGSGSESETPSNWEDRDIPAEEEQEILSPLAAVSSTDQIFPEEEAEPTTVVKSSAPSPTNSTTSKQSSVGSTVRRCLKHFTISESLEKSREKRRLESREKAKDKRERELQRDISVSDPSTLDPPPDNSPDSPLNPARTDELDTARTLPPLPAAAPEYSIPGKPASPGTAPSPVRSEAVVTPIHHPSSDGETTATERKRKEQSSVETQQPLKKKRSRGGKKKKKRSTEPGVTETVTEGQGDGERSSGGRDPNPVERLFDKGEPKATITITRQGEGGNAHHSVARALLIAPEYFNILSIRPTTDGAIIEVADQSTAMRIVLDLSIS